MDTYGCPVVGASRASSAASAACSGRPPPSWRESIPGGRPDHGGRLRTELGSQDQGSGFQRAIVSSLRFGSLAFEHTPLYRADLPVFAILGYAGKPAGILGNDLMGRYRVAIDYERSVLRFSNP